MHLWVAVDIDVVVAVGPHDHIGRFFAHCSARNLGGKLIKAAVTQQGPAALRGVVDLNKPLAVITPPS